MNLITEGVIVNRHIPRGWNTFIPPGKEGRKHALCGSKALAKYCGIPGITPQAVIYEGRPGWCQACMKELLDWYVNTYRNIPVVLEVGAAYDLVFWEMFRFMRACIDNGLVQANVQDLT